MNQCEDVSQTAHALAVKVIWQMLHNLQQTSFEHSNYNPSDLEGDIFSAAQDTETNPLHQSFVHLAQGELLFFNSSFENAANWALEVGERYTKLLPNYFPSMIETFHRAVALFAAAAAAASKKRKYRVQAKRLAKKIEQWAHAGNPNVQYYHVFLTAEQLALDKKYNAAKEKYLEAIEMVTGDVHLHHLGLLNERYSDFLTSRSLHQEAEVALRQAIRYYKQWGAAWKVKQLEARL